MPRHIRKGKFIRRIIVSHLCTAVGGQQFRKKWKKFQMRIMFELYYSFFHYFLLYCCYVMFQKRFLSKPKWGGGTRSCLGRGHGIPWPPVPTAMVNSVDLLYIFIPDLSKPHFFLSLFFHQSLFKLSFCNT